ncbi:MAG: HAD family hydrolase [Candidatus Korarchaeota archaeon]|nr:HAD family hydrolase [Candidatus Korarchaeota archaeon]
MLKLIILDLDQTLLDTLRRFHQVYSEMIGGISWEEFVKLFREDRLDELIKGDRAEFWEEFTQRFSKARHPEDRPIRGAREALERLSRRYRVVVTTGRRVPPEEVWKELREFGLSPYVHEVRTLLGHDCMWYRDALLKSILKEFGLSPDEAIFVGDYWVDMDSARRTGIRAIGVRTGLEPDERLLEHGALKIIDGIWELEEALKELRMGGL